MNNIVIIIKNRYSIFFLVYKKITKTKKIIKIKNIIKNKKYYQ